MRLENIPFFMTDWSKVPTTEHPGESGRAIWKILQLGEIRIRMVEYTPGYVADHWCSRGHILLVLEGKLVTELKDGRTFTLAAGTSYQVATDAEPHRSSSPTGAKLFIVD
ncbi:MAG: DHCW motif cupin fold protein [Bdellovibrionota bacterium]